MEGSHSITIYIHAILCHKMELLLCIEAGAVICFVSFSDIYIYMFVFKI